METGALLHTFAHTADIEAFSVSPDGRFVVVATALGDTWLWDLATGAFVARQVAFEDGTWAVLDAEGRYDASNGGDIAGVHVVVETSEGPEPVGLAQLRERYYEPGLLGKLLGLNTEPLRGVRSLGASGVALYPEVRVDSVGADGQLTVHLRNRGGGIGRVVVLVNGREVAADARAPGADPAADALTLTVPLAGLRTLLPDTSAVRENTVEVVAYNAEGYLASRGVEVGVEGTAGNAAPPDLWAVVVGTSDYAGDALDLRFAGRDAVDFGGALGLAASGLLGAQRTHLTVLSTEPGHAAPTLENLRAALRAAADSAAATDVLVVYLAGHGVTYGGVEGDFYYLTRDARSGDLSDPAVRATVAVSSAELTDLLKAVPALKQVLILDTCHSGRVVERMTEGRDVPASQVRSLVRLNDRTGTFVLAGSAADAVSYETSRYGQGLLTYSLLQGMSGAALREDTEVDVATLFGFAQDRVPELAAGIGGIQRPQLAMPRGGGSFAIGRVEGADLSRIRPAAGRPLVLRAGFQDEALFDDHLLLSDRVNEALRGASARGGAGVEFVNATVFPDAYRLVGRYRVAGEDVEVRVRIFRGASTPVAEFVTEGRTDAPDALAAAVVREAERAIPAPPP